jgi:hypothetical protein
MDKNDVERIVESAQLEDVDILLDQIDELERTLADDDIDTSKVPKVNKSSRPEQIRDVHKTLCLKNDRSRYCSIAEEMVLSGASTLEDVFNGEREIFGRRPDLVGWSSTVKLKLKRMRYETSTFVHGIMKNYGITSGGWRLLIELLPSMFLYSRRRRVAKHDHLLSASDNIRNADVQDAMNSLNCN